MSKNPVTNSTYVEIWREHRATWKNPPARSQRILSRREKKCNFEKIPRILLPVLHGSFPAGKKSATLKKSRSFPPVLHGSFPVWKKSATLKKSRRFPPRILSRREKKCNFEKSRSFPPVLHGSFPAGKKVQL